MDCRHDLFDVCIINIEDKMITEKDSKSRLVSNARRETEALNSKQMDKNSPRVMVWMLDLFNHLAEVVQLLNPNPITILHWLLGFRLLKAVGIRIWERWAPLLI